MTRSRHAFADAVAESLRGNSDRQLALEYIAQAWNAAKEDGVDNEDLAHGSLFAALATFVSTHGELAAADLVAALPDRIRAGEYTLDRSLQ